jgi:hypothetical protein
VGPFTNLRQLAVAAASVLVQLAIHQFAWTRELFDLAPLAWGDAVLALALGCIPVSVLEIWKLVRRAWPAAQG